MKAWRVYVPNHGGDIWSSCVFADTRSKAKKIWFDNWAYECCADWVDIIAHREKNFDGLCSEAKIFDGAHELKELANFWKGGDW